MSQTTVPDTVKGSRARRMYERCNEVRTEIKNVAGAVADMRRDAEVHGLAVEPLLPETIDNITLAYRHLEDASMRLGKALQALDGGVSVYDKASTVGA